MPLSWDEHSCMLPYNGALSAFSGDCGSVWEDQELQPWREANAEEKTQSERIIILCNNIGILLLGSVTVWCLTTMPKWYRVVFLSLFCTWQVIWLGVLYLRPYRRSVREWNNTQACWPLHHTAIPFSLFLAIGFLEEGFSIMITDLYMIIVERS